MDHYRTSTGHQAPGITVQGDVFTRGCASLNPWLIFCHPFGVSFDLVPLRYWPRGSGLSAAIGQLPVKPEEITCCWSLLPFATSLDMKFRRSSRSTYRFCGEAPSVKPL